MATIEITTVVQGDQAKKTLGDLRKETLGYKNELANLERGSKEYNAVLKQLAETQGQINGINQDLRASTQNLTDIYANVTRTAAGVAGGFSALSGAAALLGSDTEFLNESFVKLQAAMALSQGITALSGSFKALDMVLKALNLTILKNPYLLAGAAVIAGITALVVQLRKTTSAVDELAKSYDSLTESISRSNFQLEREIKFLRAAGADQETIIRKRIDAQQDVVDSYQRQLDNIAKAQRGANKKELEALAKQRLEVYAEYVKSNEKLQELNDDLNAYKISSDRKAMEEEDALREAAAKKRRDELEREAAEELRAIESLNAASKLLLDQRIAQANEAAYNLTQDESRIEFIKEEIRANAELRAGLEEIINSDASPQKRAEATRQLIEAEREQLALQNELIETETQVNEDRIAFEEALKEAQGFDPKATREQIEEQKEAELQAEIDRLRELSEQEGLSYSERGKALAAFNKLRDKQREDQRKKDEKDAANKRRIEDQQLADISQFLNASSQLMSDNTVAQKALSVASSTIAAYAAGSQVLADPSLPFAAKFAAMASIIATGLANVKSILSTNIPGGKDTVGEQTLSLPSFPEQLNDIQETHNNMDANDETYLNRPQRVYVTEYDISYTQNKVSIAENEAKY